MLKPMSDLAKTYEPKQVEDRLYRTWEEAGYFRARPDPSQEPFCISMPPPNITGELHIGHALDNTLPDILVRWARMRGKAALYVPGTDHASIATHVVVERELARQGKTRYDLGREAFIARVWEWKEKYGSRITHQLRRLGISCDWDRERFTMDPGLSHAVRKVFVDLFNDGLIYRGNRIINWCPRCETALSDIELVHSDEEGELAWFRYPLEAGGHIVVATTRLETMLGDTAIAVHPGDGRYRDLIGKPAVHPFLARRLPIVADEAVDPEFGSGAVKVTPAHDATDFEIAERHGSEKLNIFDTRAKVNEEGGAFAGLDRYQAREAVREALRKEGLLEKVEKHSYSIARCDRCNTVVEPWLSEQWFVRMEPLGRPAAEAVRQGRVRFIPSRWTSYYLNWLEQYRDWCISRQLWWGHRIPVWYCDSCGHVWAALDDPRECAQCGSGQVRQDSDVLDTWFSSGLWPFSTLGWPQSNADLDFFYPTVAIIPGYEIIHLWVARMVMFGLHFMGEVPFRIAYIHGIVRDAEGRKMSKSLGNTVDPLELIDRYGTDALRFMLAEHATGGDISLQEEWLAGARNFANKLWNASRFVLMNLGDSPGGQLPLHDRLTLADRWILSRWSRLAAGYTRHLGEFEIDKAAREIFGFVWSEFCDWYVEAVKLRLYGDDEGAKADVRSVLLWVLDGTLRLLHPIMPFITEELWLRLPARSGPTIMLAEWPDPSEAPVDESAEREFEQIREVVTAIRTFRSEHRVDPRRKIGVTLSARESSALDGLLRERETVTFLAGLAGMEAGELPDGSGGGARLVAGAVDVLVPFGGLVDVAAERERLTRSLTKERAEIDRLNAKLSSDAFRSKAPPEIVGENERRLEQARATEAKLVSQLEALSG